MSPVERSARRRAAAGLAAAATAAVLGTGAVLAAFEASVAEPEREREPVPVVVAERPRAVPVADADLSWDYVVPRQSISEGEAARLDAAWSAMPVEARLGLFREAAEAGMAAAAVSGSGVAHGEAEAAVLRERLGGAS